MSIISAQNVSKSYGEIQALKDFSLDVKAGQILGLLGPNGSGKTTLIKTLVGGSKPTSGNVTVFDKDPIKNKKELAHRIGYMPQESSLYEDLSVAENISFFARLHVKERISEGVDFLLRFLDMTEKKNERVQNLSGGMKTRVSLACALVHKPDLLFLDEPTAGLDPVLKRSLWDLFRKISNEGKTLIVSTHLMDEALLCDHLAIMRNGQLIVKDTPDNIIAKGAVTIKLDMGHQTVEEKLDGDAHTVANYLHSYGLDLKVKGVTIQKESLEEVAFKVMEGSV